jgi:hypothetical protein
MEQEQLYICCSSLFLFTLCAVGVQEKSELGRIVLRINFVKYPGPHCSPKLLLVASFSFVTFLLDEQKKSKGWYKDQSHY